MTQSVRLSRAQLRAALDREVRRIAPGHSLVNATFFLEVAGCDLEYEKNSIPGTASAKDAGADLRAGGKEE